MSFLEPLYLDLANGVAHPFCRGRIGEELAAEEEQSRELRQRIEQMGPVNMMVLDETNVGRLADLLHSLSKETQFLLVTHSKRMMQTADMIYGVTMQEPGVSRVVSVRLGAREQHRATA
jgi:chromosome segregation ATPase